MICPIETPKLINFLSIPSALQLSMLVPKAADEEEVESAIKKVGSNFFIKTSGFTLHFQQTRCLPWDFYAVYCVPLTKKLPTIYTIYQIGHVL